MKSQTPGFVGAQLTQARQARGLTGKALSETLKITRQAVSKYEKDKATPSPEHMDAICEELGFPLEFFLKKERLEPFTSSVKHWRSMSAATKRARTKGEWRLFWVQKMAKFASEFVDLRKANIPDFDMPSDPNLISMDQVEELATETRKAWGLRLGPLSNMVGLLERQGVIVSRAPLESTVLDAVSCWGTLYPAPIVVLNADRTSGPRKRLDVAHELGHFCLHSQVDRDLLKDPATFKLIEQQAFRFAGAFLLPEKSFAMELRGRSLDSLRLLKRRWRVSIGMMIKRLGDLGLADEREVKNMWIGMSKRGWRRNEPLDDTIPEEQPKILRKSFELIVEHNVRNREEILRELALPADEIETLAGLIEGYLTDDSWERGQVQLLPKYQPKARQTPSGPAQVIPFNTKRRR